MTDFLQPGLWGLMRAHKANLMAGHLGAAVLAGELLKRERNDLEDGVADAIDGELRRVVAGEETWFSAQAVGFGVPDLFVPVEPAAVVSDAEAQIVGALAGTLDEFHQSGHNVIFATSAMRAIRHMPAAATEPVVAGIVRLTSGFTGTRGGRGYYGKVSGWRIGAADPLPPPSAFPAYETVPGMIDEVVGEAYASRELNRRGYGSVVHLVDHTAALLDLERMGYPELALRGLPAHREHFARWRALPDVSDEFGVPQRAPYDPRMPEFWQEDLRRDTARLTHRIKGMYGLLALLDALPVGERREQAEEFLRFLVWN